MTVLIRVPQIAAALLPMLRARMAETRPPDMTVERGEGQIYLRRWWVIPRNDDCNVYLHNMLGDDEDEPHDHMYESVSLVLTDGLEERYVESPERLHDRQFAEIGGFPPAAWRRRILHAGDVVHRSATMAHQLVVREPAWTLFVTGPRVKDWGFWCPKTGKKHWREYSAVERSGTSGASGRPRGCGETS